MMRPVIGITTDMDEARCFIRPGYATAVERAGGTPILLPPIVELVGEYLAHCDGFIFSGGDDPIMEHWGVATHPKATKVHPARQEFEIALLDALAGNPVRPVLGICLGMQMMALVEGGALDQHLPESDPESAARHWGPKVHKVEGTFGSGVVLSHHRQAITDAGALDIAARADDGLIEAVRDPERPFYLGVQWHPERTEDEGFGLRLFRNLVDAATRVRG